MKISAVICEFNPFHNGHEYLLSSVRAQGATHVAAIMSGNYTQRGEAAIIDKYTRTRTALTGGADIVIELPVSYAAAWAQRFAQGGAELADALGITDELAFGSECADAELLKKAAAAIDDETVSAEMKKYLSSGMTFAAARESAVSDVYGKETADILANPNDTLAVEYIRALKIAGSDIVPRAFRRMGAAHDSGTAYGNTASASLIRKMMISSENWQDFVPQYAVENYIECGIPSDDRNQRLEAAMLYRLRMMSEKELAELPLVGEGLENRLYSAIRTECSVSGIISAVKTKRYTYARLRRILLYALLGLREEDLSPHVQYIRILGMNGRGRELLRLAQGRAKLPLITRAADAFALGDAASDFSLETRCDDIYALSGGSVMPCGRNCTEKLIVL